MNPANLSLAVGAGYDDLNLTAWDFAPPAPLVRCGL
jgi:hypothetical protein